MYGTNKNNHFKDKKLDTSTIGHTTNTTLRGKSWVNLKIRSHSLLALAPE